MSAIACQTAGPSRLKLLREPMVAMGVTYATTKKFKIRFFYFFTGNAASV